MARKHSNRRQGVRGERRAERLQLRADLIGRRSARQLGVVLSVEMVRALRLAIGQRPLPEHIREIGRLGAAITVFEVDFQGRLVAALYDHRGRAVCAFLPIDASELRAASRSGATRNGHGYTLTPDRASEEG